MIHTISSRTLAAVFLVFSMLIPSLGAAKEVVASGTVTLVQISAEETLLPDGGKVVHTISKGIVLCDDPENSMHLATQDVAGTMVFAADGTYLKGMGYADGVDLNGDVWALQWNATAEGSVWKQIDGTGIYEGIKGGGTTVVLAIHPDGRQVLRWEGAWEQKG